MARAGKGIGVLAILVVVGLFPGVLSGANPRAHSKSSKPKSATQGATMPAVMPMVAPLFIQDGEFASTLNIVNASAVSTYADVTLTGLDGKMIYTQRVQFTPHSERQLDIGALLKLAASTATTGSISVMQSSELPGMSIVAQLSMTYRGSSQPNYIDEELEMPSMTGSAVLRGVAERSEGSPLVSLTSLAQTPQSVTIQCLEQDGIVFSKSINLLAGETLITKACNERTDYGVDLETAALGGDEGHHKAVGISLTSDGMPGELAAFGLARHGGSANRYFSGVSFVDPKMQVSPNTTFTGVPMGENPLLPEGSYVPELALANFSAKTLHVHVKYATTAGTSPSILDAKMLVIPPNSSRWLSFDNLQVGDSLQNSFVVDSNGGPGDLMAGLVSRGDSKLREIEIPAKDELNRNNGGAHPWSLEDGNESTLLLFNHGTQPDYFNVWISSGPIMWQKAYLLAPMQTLALNIRELIRSGTKDDKGRTLPASALDGIVNWFPPDAGNSSGRILVSNKATAMARNFSCDLGDFLCEAQFDPGITIIVNGTTVGFGEVLPVICQGIPCKGTNLGDGGSGFTYSWVTSNVGVISISGSTSSSSVSAHGAAFGAATLTGTIYAHYDVPGYGQANCEFEGSGSGSVFGILNINPDTLLVGSSGTITISGGGLSGKGTPKVVFDAGGITVSTVTVVSDSEVTAAYSVSCSAPGQNIYLQFPSFDNVSTNQLPVFIGLPAAPAPSITFQGNNVTGATQSVIVGQQIALTGTNPALPACMSFESGSWGPLPAGSTGIGGYVASNSSGSVTPLPQNNATSYTFYWVYGGNSLQVTYAYEMSGGGGTVASPSATVTFNVTGASSATMTSLPYNALTIDNVQPCGGGTAAPALVYGNITGTLCNATYPGSTFGMKFTPSGAPSGGTYSYVQLINSDSRTENTISCSTNAGLDTAYPYKGIIPNTTPPLAEDAPGVPLPSSYTVQRTFNATMFLLWTPPTASGCSAGSACTVPVPVGYQTWGFSGSAKESSPGNGNWSATTSGTPGPVGNFVPSAGSQVSDGQTSLTSGYPTWSAVATETCN